MTALGGNGKPESIAVMPEPTRNRSKFTADDPNEIRGVNSQTELAEMSKIVRQS